MRLRIKHLLLITNAFIVLLALLGLVFFRLWDGHLVRITEQRLIAESVLVAEALRHELEGAGVRTDIALATPVLELNYDIVERGGPTTADRTVARVPTAALETAVAQLSELLDDAQVRGLSFTRILDGDGCDSDVTRPRVCSRDQPEVDQALSGRYTAVARRLPEVGGRWSWAPGNVEVATALPIAAANGVVAVVHMSRASFSPFEVFWNLRWTLLLCAGACLAFTLALTNFFSRVISRPVAAITLAAQRIARGEPAGPFAPDRFAPSEVRDLAAALDHMTAQLNERADYISNFASHASHELKTPLTGIRGAVELLLEDWNVMSVDRRERFLSNIDADAERMQRLVTRLLELARIESTAEEGETTDLREALGELCAFYGDQVRADLSRAPNAIPMSREHLETAVRNLIDNAIRHGGGEPVDLRVWHDGRRVRIEVRDRGAGISERNRARIFDRFFTTARDNGGTGLGLPIVKAIAELRGGSIEVETGDAGTAFTIAV
jgi:signal transduction histidine kinase